MSANLLLLIWVQSLILLGGAWIACRLVKSPVVRQWVCRAGLLGAAALAVAAPLAIGRRSNEAATPFHPIVLQIPVPMESGPLPSLKSAPEPARSPAPLSTQDAPATAAPAVAKQLDLPAGLILVWGVGAALFALHALIGLCLLALLRLRSRPCGNARVLAVAENCREKLSLRRLRIRETFGNATPFVAGIVGPSVYVSARWVEDQTDDALEAFLCHEAGHVARCDLAWMAFHRLTQIILWPQPFVWLLGKPMSLASEELCDRHVIAAGAEPAGYADRLLLLAESKPQKVWAIRYGFGIAHSRSALGRRLEAIIQGKNLSELRVSRRARLGLTFSLVPAVVLATLAFAVPQAKAKNPVLLDPPQGVVSIKILTPDGKPITQARAWMIDQGTIDYSNLTYDPFSNVRVEEVPVVDGVAKVDFSVLGRTTQVLAVEAAGYGFSFEKRWPNDKPDADFVLRAGSRLTGRLLLPDGRPAAGIRLFPARIDCRQRRHIILANAELRARYSATTDAAGRYAIEGLPQGANLALDTDDKRFAAIPSQRWVAIGDSASTETQDIRLVPAATIEGRVLRGGKPVGEVYVECMDRDARGMAVTNANGRYRIERLREGLFRVAVVLFPPMSEELTAAAREEVVVKAGDHKSGLDFALVRGALIKGRVTYSDGSPASVLVQIQGPGNPRGMAISTDEAGNYRLRVPAGRQSVSLPEFPIASKVVTVKDGEERMVNFDAGDKRNAVPAYSPKMVDSEQPVKRTANVRILTPEGKALKSARAWLFERNIETRRETVKEITVKDGLLKITDKGDTFLLALLVEAPGYGLSGTDNAHLAPQADLEIVMSRETRVAGRLLLPNGKPAGGMRVFPKALWCAAPSNGPKTRGGIAAFLQFSYPHMRDRYTAVTDRDGRFVLKGLPHADGLVLEMEDKRFKMQSLPVQPSTVAHSVITLSDIRLSNAAAIEGRVFRSGRPAAGVTVGCMGVYGANDWLSAKTDSNGRYRIERLMPGTYNVGVSLPLPKGQELTAAPREAIFVKDGGRAKGVDFELVKGALIVGRVTYADGTPAARTPVGVFKRPGKSYRNWVQTVYTDRAGNYRLRVPEGDKFICLVGGLDSPKPLTLKAGEARTVDLTARREVKAVHLPPS
jgi:beta-lactamase regulating signal transducer with metallopeptidase domain